MRVFARGSDLQNPELRASCEVDSPARRPKNTQAQPARRVEGIELRRTVHCRDRVRQVSLAREQQTHATMARRIAGAELERATKVRLRAAPVAQEVHAQQATRRIRLGEIRTERYRPLRLGERPFAKLQCGRAVLGVETDRTKRDSELGSRWGIGRIETDRLLVCFHRAAISISRLACVILSPQKVLAVGLDTRRPPLVRRGCLLR